MKKLSPMQKFIVIIGIIVMIIIAILAVVWNSNLTAVIGLSVVQFLSFSSFVMLVFIRI